MPVSFMSSVSVMTPMGTQRLEAERAVILECSGCRQRVVVIEERWLDDHRATEDFRGSGTENFPGVWWWPPPGLADLDASIPPPIADAYREGIRAMWAQAPRAAAVMFRRTLEAIVKTSGSQTAKAAAEQNLASGLTTMADEGALDRSLADWAKEIRIVGNVGGHFDASGGDVSAAEAEDLSRLLRELLRYLYEMPARITRSRGS